MKENAPMGKSEAMIAAGGFAVMAWELAWQRVWQSPAPERPPDPRNESYLPSDIEYYAILDRAASGVAAYRAARKLGMLGDNFTVTL
jgi:hypothetical protein